MGKQWKQWKTIFLGSKITVDGDCSHEIKRHLLLGRKAMTNLDSVLKSRNITLLTKVRIVKAMSLLFNTLSRFVIAFLPRSKCLLISWWQSPSTVILEPKNIKAVTVSIYPLLFTMKWWDQMPWSWFFECWVLSQIFQSLPSPSSRGSLVPLSFLP